MKLNNSSYSHPKIFVSKKLEKRGNTFNISKPRKRKEIEVLIFQKNLLTNFALREKIHTRKKICKSLVKNQKFYGLPLIKKREGLTCLFFIKNKL